MKHQESVLSNLTGVALHLRMVDNGYAKLTPGEYKKPNIFPMTREMINFTRTLLFLIFIS